VGFVLLPICKWDSLKCHSQMWTHRYNVLSDDNTLSLLLPLLSFTCRRPKAQAPAAAQTSRGGAAHGGARARGRAHPRRCCPRRRMREAELLAAVRRPERRRCSA
jgi:hypothetical protein